MQSTSTIRLAASADLLNDMRDAHARSAAAIGTNESSFAFAGGTVDFSVAGDALAASMLDVFSHLKIPGGGKPDLRVMVWDISASNVARPLPDMRKLFAGCTPFGDGLVARDGAVIGFQSPRIYAFLDLDSNMLIGCAEAADQLSAYEIGKPLQPLMFPWFQSRGIQPLHGALVAEAGHGILFGGKGGSGKSTTALTCAGAGMDFLGDDYVGLSFHAHWRGHSFYSSAWLESDHSRTVDGVAGHRLKGVDTGELKDSFSVTRAFPGALRAETTISAIALPKVTDQDETRFQPLSSTEALVRLAPSTVLQMQHLDAGSVFKACARLTRDLPCYELQLGRDRSRIADCVRACLEDATR